jgi:dipeptidyl aminopeptidase/acylaminoacyl peptidase
MLKPRASRTKRLSILLTSLAATALAIPASAEPAVAASPPPAITAPPPPEAFASLPAIRDVTLSPGGAMIAYFDSSAGDSRIVMFDIAAKKIVRILALEAGMTFRQLHWNDDSTLLYELSMSVLTPSRRGPHEGPDIEREFYRIYATEAANPAPRLMLNSDMELGYVTGMTVLKWHTSKPHTMIVETRNFSQRGVGGFDSLRGRGSVWALSVYEVDTQTGKGTMLDIGDPYTHKYVVDADGKLLARDEWNLDTRTYDVIARRGGTWSKIYAEKRHGPLQMLEPTADAKAVWLLGEDTDGHVKLWSLPLDGSPRKIAFEDPQSIINRVTIDDTGALQAVWTGPSDDNPTWFDKTEEQRRAAMRAPFPNLQVDFRSHSDDKHLQILSTSGAASPPVFYLIDLKSHRASIVGSEYPALDGVKLGKVLSFNYKAHDGTDIPGYLTLPPDASSATPPLIVLPHGFPDERDDLTFEWLRQYLATRGYAVFQPQFRGSWGFSAAFQGAGDRQWGLLMQDDITDGVHALIDQGKADPNRICIVGYSSSPGYEGYAALAGAAFTPDLYQCAVSINGISDLPTFLDFQDQRAGADSANVAYWHRRIGERGDPNVISRSPARAVEQFKAPVLLIYSAHDSVVPIDQSTHMAEAMRNHARRVELVELPDEDHHLSHTPTRLQALAATTKFLHDHLQKAP